MDSIPCFYCGDGVIVGKELELEISICESCIAELYGVYDLEGEDIHTGEEVVV